MSSFKVGDAVCCIVRDVQRIGLIKRVGINWSASNKTKYIGIELVEQICGGHNGKVNGTHHFDAKQGHGVIVQIKDIIQKLTISQLIMRMQQIISERDTCIEQLRKENHRMNNVNQTSLVTAFEQQLLSPSMSKITPLPSPQKRYLKHSDYTKQSKWNDVDSDRSETSDDEDDISWRDAMSPLTPFSANKQQKILTAYSPQLFGTIHSNQTQPIKIRSVNKSKVIEPYHGPVRKRRNSMVFLNKGNEFGGMLVGSKRSNSLDFTSPKISPIALNHSPHHAMYTMSPHSIKLCANSSQFAQANKSEMHFASFIKPTRARRFGVPVPEIRTASRSSVVEPEKMID